MLTSKLLVTHRAVVASAALRDAESALDDVRHGRSGRLRVVSFHTAGESLLASAIATLQQTLPRTVVQPVLDNTEGALRRLRSGQVRPSLLLSSTRVARNRMMTCAAPTCTTMNTGSCCMIPNRWRAVALSTFRTWLTLTGSSQPGPRITSEMRP